MTGPNRARLRLLVGTALVIAAGLALRLLGLGLPGPVVKWGGSVLWGAMVYGLVGLVLPLPRWRIVAVAAAIALVAGRGDVGELTAWFGRIGLVVVIWLVTGPVWETVRAGSGRGAATG